MQENDRREFAGILKATLEVFDKVPSDDALMIWWSTMQEISVQDFRRAMSNHLRTSQFAPKPADILNQFKKHDGRPGPEEAWAMIPKDEKGSVVWTEEMATAYGAAQPLLSAGDHIGARMAFKEAYDREVDAATRAGKPVKWIPSFGHDPYGREKAVDDAINKNRISMDRAMKLLPGNDNILALDADKKPQLVDQSGLQRIKGLIATIGPVKAEEKPVAPISEEELLSRVKVVVRKDEIKNNNSGAPE